MIRLLLAILTCILSSCWTYVSFDKAGNPVVASTSDVGHRTDFSRTGRVGLLTGLTGDTGQESLTSGTDMPGMIRAENTRNGTLVLMTGISNPIWTKLPDAVSDVVKIGVTGKSIDNIVDDVTDNIE